MTAALPAYEEWRERLFRGKLPEFEELWTYKETTGLEWLLSYASRLFEETSSLAIAYTEAELERGFWGLLHEWELADLLWHRLIDWTLRKQCIEAMVYLYTDLFCSKPCDSTCFMWWDLLRTFEDNPDPQVLDVMFATLARVLELPSEHCQHAALHGLGHLQHPEKRALIERYLQRGAGANARLRAYAEASITGKVL